MRKTGLVSLSFCKNLNTLPHRKRSIECQKAQPREEPFDEQKAKTHGLPLEFNTP